MAGTLKRPRDSCMFGVSGAGEVRVSMASPLKAERCYEFGASCGAAFAVRAAESLARMLRLSPQFAARHTTPAEVKRNVLRRQKARKFSHSAVCSPGTRQRGKR
jgi:hypothetical protein